jgi:glycosyltransferase involved in cell wall biosynthesis
VRDRAARPDDPDAAPGVSVVLPTHNELPNLAELIPRLREALAGERLEILVVDDASTDGSVEWLNAQAAADPSLRPLFGDALLGIGHALRRGYDAARGEVIVSVDADLSFEAAVAPQLLAAVRAGHDLVIGSRHHRGGSYSAPNATIARKRFVSRWANRVLRLAVPVGISDFSVDCRALRRDLWCRLELKERTNIWLIEMVVMAAAAGARLGEVPVAFQDRRFGASKLRLGREILLTGYRVLLMIARYWRARLGGRTARA